MWTLLSIRNTLFFLLENKCGSSESRTCAVAYGPVLGGRPDSVVVVTVIVVGRHDGEVETSATRCLAFHSVLTMIARQLAVFRYRRIGTRVLCNNDPSNCYPSRQWRRSVVNYGRQGQSGQAVQLFQAPRKIIFTFRFLTQAFHP